MQRSRRLFQSVVNIVVVAMFALSIAAMLALSIAAMFALSIAAMLYCFEQITDI